jgi:hypothetical protein
MVEVGRRPSGYLMKTVPPHSWKPEELGISHFNNLFADEEYKSDTM